MKNLISLFSIMLFYTINVNAQQGDLEVTGTVKVGAMLPSDSDSIVVWNNDGTLGKRSDIASKAYVDALEDRVFDLEYSLGKDSISDMDGSYYKIKKIGTQYWMAENLRTMKYSDGSAITYVQDSAMWSVLTTEGYCFYDTIGTGYSTYSQATFGALYNWFAVNDSRGLCPSGWHVPSDEEWTVLIDYLDPGEVDPNAVGSQSSFAGQKMKEAGTIHWIHPNTGASNISGFSGFPGGYRISSGLFLDSGYQGAWWSDSGIESGAWFRFLDYNSTNVNRRAANKEIGFSVRCTRD